MSYRSLAVIAFLCVACRSAPASLIHFQSFNQWTSQVDEFNTIDFTGFPNFTFINTQYASQGIVFASVAQIIFTESLPDGGLFGPNGIRMVFDAPQQLISVHYVGNVQFELSYQGQVIASSELFQEAGTGVRFAGLISDQPFDEVYIFKPQPPFSNNNIVIDKLYWGAPIPVPGALPLLALAFMSGARRRRS